MRRVKAKQLRKAAPAFAAMLEVDVNKGYRLLKRAYKYRRQWRSYDIS